MISNAGPTTAEILDELLDVASNLGETAVMESIETIREHGKASKLQMLIVGSIGSGRCTLANTLLRGPAVLPESPIPKAPLGIDVAHGERTAVTFVARDGSRRAIVPAQLGSFLLAGSSDPEDRVQVRVDSDLLEMTDLRIESLGASHPDGRWRDILAGVDYVFLLLNSTALLSTAERAFVREHLVKEFGLERVAIVLTKLDLIPEDERASILEMVHTFLGPFQSQPAIVELPARDEMSEQPPSYDALTTLIGDLLQRRVPLRATAMRQSLESVLDDLEDAAARMRTLYVLEESEVQDIQSGIASQSEWLHRRIERMQQRVTALAETLLKEQLMRRLEAFGDTFRARLPQEIDSVDDPLVVRRHLPGYIETVWTEFVRAQMISVRANVMDESARIGEMIEADLRELLALASRGKVGIWTEVGIDGRPFHVFVTPRRGKHRATNIMRGLSMQGFIMLFISPAFGVLSLAATQVVQRMYQDQIKEADRAAITASAVTAARELEREVKRRIDPQFTEIGKQLKADVAEAYREGVERITEMLDERTSHRYDIEARRVEIASISRETLPRLRAFVAGLDRSAAG